MTSLLSRKPRTHELKCWPEYFLAVRDGRKPFEVRKNDRDFRTGDALILREWNPFRESYTGHRCNVDVTYVLHGGQFGIEKGYVVMGIRHV